MEWHVIFMQHHHNS